MKNDWDVAIHNIGLFLLIGFLCWLFNHWWPVFLMIFVGTSSRKVHKEVHKRDAEGKELE